MVETIERFLDKKKDGSPEGKDLETRIAEKEQELRNVETNLGYAYVRLGHLLAALGLNSKIHYESRSATEGKMLTAKKEATDLEAKMDELQQQLVQLKNTSTPKRFKTAA